jgi:hypothetical protein
MLLCCARCVTAAALRAESTGGPALDYKPHDISLSKLAGRFAFFMACSARQRCNIVRSEDVLNEETFGTETGGEAAGAQLSL